MKRTGLLLILLATLVGTPRRALAVDGSTLYQKCLAFDKTDPTELDKRDAQFCNGYLAAAFEFVDVDNHRTTTSGKPVESFGFCVPDNVHIREVVLVYLNYMKANPTMMHQFAALGVLNAFGDAYPCKR